MALTRPRLFARSLLSGTWNRRVRHCNGRYFTTTTFRSGADDKVDFFQSFITSNSPPQSSIDYFSSIPWTSRILKDSTYEALPFYSRHPFSSGENALFSRLTNTDDTIPYLLSFRLRDLKTPPPLVSGAAVIKPAAVLPEVLALLSLQPGLNAHPTLCHGGFQGVIFDEIIRFLILVHYNNDLTSHPHSIPRDGPRVRHYTLRMGIEYFAPVTTPTDVLVRASLERRVGRKWVATADMVDQEGKVLSRAESLWVTAKSREEQKGLEGSG
ncbi:hypothetical protein C1H76_3895 [Elsinoe australis]|uniref:Thioesterase domain-containing protein n=1 Tax=Elsinoe australis TaxID=40998 RepID=A0A4U7B8N4_9PEZI|nr:hypothetical protein C1H76_3895 [Elsinoe australis]